MNSEVLFSDRSGVDSSVVGTYLRVFCFRGRWDMWGG